MLASFLMLSYWPQGCQNAEELPAQSESLTGDYPIIIIIIGIITTDSYGLPLSREMLYSSCEIAFSLLFTEELEASQAKIYWQVTPKALQEGRGLHQICTFAPA